MHTLLTRFHPAYIAAGWCRSSLTAGGLGALLLLLAACDAGFSGDETENQPPDTELSVQVEDLGETLGEGALTSTVTVEWAGTDPDGFVAAYDLRYFNADADANTAAWTRTTRRDTALLLPIPSGESTARVTVEVRAIDNDGAVDPAPARTIFPIRNAPPTLRLSGVEVPPDTTWPAVSFSWEAGDPDGEANLAAIEVALNDSVGAFIRLPAETTFITLVADDPRASQTAMRVLLGRSGTSSSLRIPNLRTDADNTLYVRAVDAAGLTSATAQYPDPNPDAGQTWFVRRVSSPVLLVNDYRSTNNDVVIAYHRALLDAYGSPEGYDQWYLAAPFQEGSTAPPMYSDNLPPSAEPTLRETLRFWQHIYWVSNNATNATLGNNLPLVASVADQFFENGGRMFVNVIVRAPTVPEDNLGNASLALLPLSEPLSLGPGSPYPDFRRTLDLLTGAAITPAEMLPLGKPLPTLKARRFVGGTFAYPVSESTIELYRGEYTATLESDGSLVPWTGPSTVSSMSADRRVALFALPLVNPQNGESFFEGADGDPDAPQDAVHLILEALGFPR